MCAMGNENLTKAQVKWLTYLVYILISMVTISNGWLVSKVFDLENRKVNHEEFTHSVDNLAKVLLSNGRDMNSKFENLKDTIYRFHTNSQMEQRDKDQDQRQKNQNQRNKNQNQRENYLFTF